MKHSHEKSSGAKAGPDKSKDKNIRIQEEFTSPRSAFIGGAKALFPIWTAVVPFAVLSGITVISVGFSPVMAASIALFVYAGAGILAAADLTARGAPFLIVIATCLIVNLRFTMYSAAMAPHFKKLPRRLLYPMTYLISDQGFAVFTSRYDGDSKAPYKVYFYFGAGVMMWLGFQLGFLIGVVFGIGIPDSWSLEFAVPLMFLALLTPHVKSKPKLSAAVTAGIIAVFANGLPLNLGLVAGALGGIAVGITSEILSEKKAALNSENNH